MPWDEECPHYHRTMIQGTQLPTQAERDFTFHYYQEELRHKYQGPAHQWVTEHGISNGSMIAFGYWEQRNNPEWFNRLLEVQAPPFQVPWSSADEFFVRVRELLELYPEVKSITPDHPRPVSPLVSSKGQ
jgi:hypothetical protein